MGEFPADAGSGSDDPTIAPRTSAAPGRWIGPYRLLEPLGEGGMGEVWLAEQTRPVQRQVALKVMKAGMDTAQVVARFEAERQALALKQEKYAEAEPILRQVVELRRRLLGADHRSTGTALNNLAVVLYRAGRPDEAVPVMEQAREVAVKQLSPGHPFVLSIDGSLAAMIAAQGRHAEAEALFKRTLEGRIEVLGAEHPEVAGTLVGYGRFLAGRRRFAEAEPLLVQAVEMRQRLLGADHPETARAVRELAALYRATGDVEKAETLESRPPD